MTQEQPGQAVPIPAAGAVPKPAPAEQVNLAAGKHQAKQEMSDAEVSEPQLAQSKLRREVIDDLIARHHPQALDDTLTPEQARDAHQAAKATVLSKFSPKKIDELMAEKYRERTTGQAVRNRERLSPDVDLSTGKDIPVELVIDGRTYEVVGYSPTKTRTVVVLPSDVKPGAALPSQLHEQGVKAEFEHVAITAGVLSALASEVKAAAGSSSGVQLSPAPLGSRLRQLSSVHDPRRR